MGVFRHILFKFNLDYLYFPFWLKLNSLSRACSQTMQASSNFSPLSSSHISRGNKKMERKNSMGPLSDYCVFTAHSTLITLLVILERSLANIAPLQVEGRGVKWQQEGASPDSSSPILSWLLQNVAASSTLDVQWGSPSGGQSRPVFSFYAPWPSDCGPARSHGDPANSTTV